jgi:phosphohistidine phosphatase SixA
VAVDLAALRWPTATRVLLSHAHAAGHTKVDALDSFRALSPAGWAQADGLSAELGGVVDFRCLLSSPSLRCRQTLMPLAQALGLDIDPVPELARSAGVDGVLRLLCSEAAHGAALCTHPEMVAGALMRLRRDGVALGLSVTAAAASAWLIEDRSDVAAAGAPA